MNYSSTDLKKYIEQNEIDVLIKLLLNHHREANTNVYNEVIQISSRYNEYKNSLIRRDLSEDNLRIQKSQLNNSLILLIDETFKESREIIVDEIEFQKSNEQDLKTSNRQIKLPILITIGLVCLTGMFFIGKNFGQQKNSTSTQKEGALDEISLSENAKKDLYYFKINHVGIDVFDDNQSDIDFTGIRVHGHVYENPISYPIKTLWTNFGVKYSSSVYPVFLDKEEGPIGFEILAIDNNGEVHNFYSISNLFERYNLQSLPFTYNMRLCTSSTQDNIEACADLNLEIRKTPF